ncbi:MAG TPA: anhydro-N-acetylmuramic acid kinase [Candidatus Baltobacteraceae bacterium]|nr:anhydro-N-acetylmuramic acid kinase [Candidatus Baltobacteraceae bacterium]
MIAIGLMSGTSLDGIDAALVRIAPRDDGYAIGLMNFVTLPYDRELAGALRAALPPNEANAPAIADLHRRLGSAYARAARAACGSLTVDYIASHGQTIFHDGAAHVTMQIGDPFVLREALQATVCYDFRSADCVVGGTGAPLVPYVDAMLLADANEDRVAVNIGGIANLTALPRGCTPHDLTAFDCGPGMMLIDAFVQQRTEGALRYDEDGALAAAGTANEAALIAMLGDPYFAQPPPKSTGRERFGAQFLQAYAQELDRLSIEDGAATLTELTAIAVAGAIASLGLAQARVLCSGGGARNLALMRRIAERLPQARVEPSDVVGLPGDAKEAIAFAVLGYETLRERAANVPRVTGASRAVPLGAIAPFELRRLISEVEKECQSS